MGFPIYRLVSLGVFLICWSGFGSAVRIVTKPEPYSERTEELRISCLTDEPIYIAKTIFSIQLLSHNEDTIVVINDRQKLKMGPASRNNMKAQGHVDTADATKSRLTLTIQNPKRQDAGNYRCRVFFTDETFNIVEDNVAGNVTHQEADIRDTVKDLEQKVATLLAEFQKQQTQNENLSNTIVKLTQQNENQTNLIDTLTQQNKNYNNLIDNLTKQNQNQSNLINKLKKDNTNKQQQLDLLLQYIQQQNKTIQKHELQLKNMAQKLLLTSTTPATTTPTTTTMSTTTISLTTDSTSKTTGCPDDGWTLYKQDNTCLQTFGKDTRSQRLGWTMASESCQSFGGHLVIIRDENKNKFVYDLFDGARTRYDSAWIGLKNKARSGFEFKYVDESELGSYHPWYGSDPHGNGDSDVKCVAMFTDTSDPRQWFDSDCSDRLPYTCSISALND